MPNIPGPRIQGYAVGKQDYTVALNGYYMLQNLQTLDWDGSIEESLIYGLSQEPIGRTVGQFTPAGGNLTLLAADWGSLVSFLSGLAVSQGLIGYSNAVVLGMAVNATPISGPPINTLLRSVRFTGDSGEIPTDTGGSVVKVKFSYLTRSLNGTPQSGL